MSPIQKNLRSGATPVTTGSGRPKKGYWYDYTDYFCPQCGRSQTFKERVYDRPKPATYQERHEEIEAWDYCD